jgi:hypothetical protein
MKLIRTLWREALGLFVDDGALALAIIAWLIAVGLLVRFVLGAASWGGGWLFAGLAVILLESAWRRARK